LALKKTDLEQANGTATSLAARQNLFLNPTVAFKSVAIELKFDDRLIEIVGAKSLPQDWTEHPHARSMMRLGVIYG
jgi:hypothetical protein